MKTIIRLIFIFIALILAFAIYIFYVGNKNFDVPIPAIKASDNPEIIERGAYLVNGAAHCRGCHVPFDKMRAVDEGEKIPMIGGYKMELPPATIVSQNLTPDKLTGIGRYSDGALARAIRDGVRPNGKLLFPVMNYQNMSDEDVIAIISYLRAQEPVEFVQLDTKYTFLGKMLQVFGVLKPYVKEQNPPKSIKRDTTVAYGEYFARNIGNCMACHTETDLKTGKFTKPEFSGGFYFPPEPFSEGYSFYAPNLTPDKETGITYGWSEDQFIQRFKAGRVHRGSPMPWGMFEKIDTSDLKALYNFLSSLDPVNNNIEQIAIAPE